MGGKVFKQVTCLWNRWDELWNQNQLRAEMLSLQSLLILVKHTPPPPLQKSSPSIVCFYINNRGDFLSMVTKM